MRDKGSFCRKDGRRVFYFTVSASLCPNIWHLISARSKVDTFINAGQQKQKNNMTSLFLDF